MKEIHIRRAVTQDIPALDYLLYEVHRVHSEVRPDLFKNGAKNIPMSNFGKFWRMINGRFLWRSGIIRWWGMLSVFPEKLSMIRAGWI